NLTAFPELIPQVNPPIRTWWFAELIDVRNPNRTSDLVELAIDAMKRARDSGGGIGLAPHALFTASANLYRRCEEIAQCENILLGTDSPASNEDLSLFAEMRAFQRSEPAFSPKEVLEMVTGNAALALGKPQALGRIHANRFADLIAIPCSETADVFEEILEFDRPVDWMMVAGKT